MQQGTPALLQKSKAAKVELHGVSAGLGQTGVPAALMATQQGD